MEQLDLPPQLEALPGASRDELEALSEADSASLRADAAIEVDNHDVEQIDLLGLAAVGGVRRRLQFPHRSAESVAYARAHKERNVAARESSVARAQLGEATSNLSSVVALVPAASTLLGNAHKRVRLTPRTASAKDFAAMALVAYFKHRSQRIGDECS